MHAGEQIGVHHIRRAGLGDAVFVALGRIRLGGGNKSRAHIGQIRTHRLCRQHRRAIGNATGQHDQTVVKLANLTDQGKRAECTGMTARTRRHQNQAVHARFQRFFRMACIDHVV